jgi:molybdopterin/thiamine biosynthesis adenylyltransferase
MATVDFDTLLGETEPAADFRTSRGRAADDTKGWTYEEAFKRNRGLVTEQEQEILRNSRVVIAGMGGVGGVHLVTLARLGVGKFTIADPDVFEVANFNRQFGATISNLGRNKAEAIADIGLDINPELDVRVFRDAVDESNVEEFLDGADVFVDGLDFFAIDARRLVFQRAQERGIWAVTAGPIGFSTAWLSFDPRGMKFDEYFDFREGMTQIEMLISFAVGLTPKGMHLRYMDLSKIRASKATTPCCSFACSLAAGVAADRILGILTGKGAAAVPVYEQFDPRVERYVRRRLRFGNRHPLQRLKRRILMRRFADAQMRAN